jgi:hypothetical protein
MTTIYLGSSIQSYDLSYTDLTSEAETLESKGETVECYNLVTENDNGLIEKAGTMLYVPSAQRAGLCFGGDSQWTDAGSAEDAVRRYNDDEMIN